jgi:hypothetical protein
MAHTVNTVTSRVSSERVNGVKYGRTNGVGLFLESTKVDARLGVSMVGEHGWRGGLLGGISRATDSW